MSKSSKKRFYTPNIDGWKYNNDNNIEEIADNETGSLSEESEEEKSPIDDKSQKAVVKKHFEFFNWTLSFTKNVVQACFILFLIVNIFIAGMITYVYIKSQQVVALEIYISEVYNMFITVIGGYIIKSTTENTIKIVFSVLSDWLEKKYGITDRLKEPEAEDNTFIFTGNRPTPQSGILADGSTTGAEDYTDYGSDPENINENDIGEVAVYKSGEDESGE